MDTEHKLLIMQRERIEVTGVTEVDSFDTEEICVKTQRGLLRIKGRELHVTKLALDSGIVTATGLVCEMVYPDDKTEKAGSFISRLFK